MTEDSNKLLLKESFTLQNNLAQERLQFIINFYVAIKNSRLFEPNNDAVLKSIKNLMSSIHSIFKIDGCLTIKVMHNNLVLNDKRLKFSLSLMACCNSVLAELCQVKIGVLSFERNIDEEHLRQFIYLLGKFKPQTQDKFKDFSDQMMSCNIQSIIIEPENNLEDNSIDTNIKERSKNAYFQSISLAREMLTQAQKMKAINFRKTKRIVQNLIDVALEDDRCLLSLSSIKNHDQYTFNHSANVCVLSISFGQKLGLSKLTLEALGIGALLHDIGKIFIPLEILNKPGKLSDDEWNLMRRHPSLGAKSLLKSHINSDMLLNSLLIAYEHHQRIDMTGYPDVKEKREQNLLSSIVAIADCYDAMTTPRVYRKFGIKPPEALRIMVRDSGKAFNSTLLKLFIYCFGLYPIGSLVKLSSSKMGLVYSINPKAKYIDRPLVKIITEPNEKASIDIIDLTEIDNATGKFKDSIVDYFTSSEYFENINDYLDAL